MTWPLARSIGPTPPVFHNVPSPTDSTSSDECCQSPRRGVCAPEPARTTGRQYSGGRGQPGGRRIYLRANLGNGPWTAPESHGYLRPRHPAAGVRHSCRQKTPKAAAKDGPDKARKGPENGAGQLRPPAPAAILQALKTGAGIVRPCWWSAVTRRHRRGDPRPCRLDRAPVAQRIILRPGRARAARPRAAGRGGR